MDFTAANYKILLGRFNITLSYNIDWFIVGFEGYYKMNFNRLAHSILNLRINN